MTKSILPSTPADIKKPQQAQALASQVLTFRGNDGSERRLTSARLEQWFVSVDAANPHKVPGYFGLKNAQETIAFLRSHSGQSLISAMNEELAEIASLEDQQFIENRDRDTLRHRRLALLFLGLACKRNARARELNRVIQEQIDKTLHQKPDSQPGTAQDSAPPPKVELYKESIDAMESTLESRQKEKALLDQEILQLHQEWIVMAERHALLTGSMVDLERFHTELMALRPEDRPAFLEEQRHLLLAETDTIQAQASLQLLPGQEPQFAMEHLHRNRLQLEGFNDLHALTRGEKILYDANGEQTSSSRDASFILSPDMKIAKDGAGVFYLLPASADLSQMDEAQKDKAMRRFDKRQTEILTVPKLVNHYCAREQELHEQRSRHVHQRSKSVQDDINLLANQLRKVQSAQAAMIAELAKPSPDPHRSQALQDSMPKLSNSNHSFAFGKADHEATIADMRHIMNSMQRNPNQAQLEALTKGLKALYGKTGQEIPSFLVKNINRITPGQPVPLRIMMGLHMQVQKLEHSLAKQSIEQKATSTSVVEPPRPSTAPTPFGIWPPKPGSF